MIMTQSPTQKQSKFSQEKYIFNCQAYRLQGDTWVKLEKLFIDNQFDNKENKGISKVKVKGQKGYQNTYIVKITFNQKDAFYSMAQELQLRWFVHTVNTKIAEKAAINLSQGDYINVCAGYVYKKSGFLGDWEKCYVMITREGLTASKDEKTKPDFQIEGVKEIWTRFQLIQKNSYMVFKLRDFFKYEFGVPTDTLAKWTKAFYSLINFD